MITADEVGSGENVPPLPGGGGDDLNYLKRLSSYRQYESACLLILPLKPVSASCFWKSRCTAGQRRWLLEASSPPQSQAGLGWVQRVGAERRATGQGAPGKELTKRNWQPKRSGQRKRSNSECLLLARSLGGASSDWSALVQTGGTNSTLDQAEFEWRHLVWVGFN